MATIPTLKTDRLCLRQFQSSDAPEVQRLAGVKEVAAGTFLPHPYPDGTAEQWIASQQEEFDADTLVNFAIVLLAHDILIGSIGLAIVAEHEHARMSYWLGMPTGITGMRQKRYRRCSLMDSTSESCTGSMPHTF